MKGVVFNLLEEVVRRNLGEEAWDDLLDRSAVGGSYTSLGNYSDDEMAALVGAASEALGKTPAEVLRWFGREAMPVLAERYPALFAPHESSRPFVLSVNAIIHPEVRKLYAGAECPHFRFSESPEGALLMSYHSSRRLCALAQGFVEGAGRHYKEGVTVDHYACKHEGDPECLFKIDWAA